MHPKFGTHSPAQKQICSKRFLTMSHSKTPNTLGKRSFLKAVLATSLAALALSPASLFAQSAPKEIRIGDQKNGLLYLAKETGQLEEFFKAKI